MVEYENMEYLKVFICLTMFKKKNCVKLNFSGLIYLDIVMTNSQNTLKIPILTY